MTRCYDPRLNPLEAAMSRAFHFLPLPILALASCGAGDATANLGERVRYFSLNDLRPAKVQVVDVREQDLKEMPLGGERALAYEKSAARTARHWIFSGPVNFQEPVLPEAGTDVADSLLPPKAN